MEFGEDSDEREDKHNPCNNALADVNPEFHCHAVSMNPGCMIRNKLDSGCSSCSGVVVGSWLSPVGVGVGSASLAARGISVSMRRREGGAAAPEITSWRKTTRDRQGQRGTGVLALET